MSEHVTVEAVKDARDWQSDDGKIKLTFYTLDVKRENGLTTEVDHSRKQGGKEPQPGEELDVIFEEGKYRPKMKKVPQGSFAGGGAERSTGSSKKDWTPENERDPERSARILRQHSQSAALEYAIATKFFDGLNETNTRTDARLTVPDQFWRLVDQFDQDVNAAGQAATSAQGAARNNESAGFSHSPSASPESNSQSAGETAQYFARLLEDAAMDPVAAVELGKFIAFKFSDEQRKRAENGLRELERQQDTVKRLTLAYEQSEAKLLPLSSDDDEDLPF